MIRSGVVIAGAAFVAATAIALSGAMLSDRPSALDLQIDAMRDGALHHEQAIADCMRQHGFEYAVALPADVLVEEARRRAAARGEDPITAGERAERAAPPDPNVQLVAALPPDRQRAWNDTLWGDDTWPGCASTTFSQAWGVDTEELLARGEQLVAQTRSHPDVIAARQRYVECMAALGFAVDDPEQFNAVLDQTLESLDDDAAHDYRRAARAAHESCAPDYQSVYNDVYRRLSRM